MKKRFGLLSLIGATAVLIAMVGAITALAAPAGADKTGTISLDESWYTITPADPQKTAQSGHVSTGNSVQTGAAIEVTVTDADMNITTAASLKQHITMVAALATTSTPLPLAAGEEIVGVPEVLSAGDTDCAADTPDADITVSVQNKVTGVIILQTLAGGLAAEAAHAHNSAGRTICYDKGAKDNVNITLSSTQDTDGIYISTTETGIDTGVFEVSIQLDALASTATSPFYLKSLDLDTITAKYKDSKPTGGGSAVTVSATASVEQGKPAFSSLVPADELATQNTQPTYTGTINDVGGAGIDVSTVKIIFDAGTDSGSNAPTVTGADGDTSVTYTFTSGIQSAATLKWYVESSDMAGNAGRSDADSDTAGNQDFEIKIDITAPAVLSAETGVTWDADDKAEEKGTLTALVVRFDDKIDSDTVSAADFTVEGIAPLTAQMFAKSSKNDVYLTMATALAADDEPVVILAGTLSDLAGNSRTGGTVDAKDKIAPSFTVTLDTALAKSAEKVKITVTSTEKISGVPSIKVHNIDGSTISTLSVVVKSSVSWEATFTATSSYTLKNSVVVIGADPDGNSATKGSATIADAKFGSKALILEVDVTDPTITYDAAGVNIGASGSTEVDSTTPYITVTFSEKVTVDKAEFGEKGETLTAVTGSLSTDAKKWIYAATGLTEDEEYTISVEVTDLAGNDVDGTADFEVVEVPDVKVLLSPGMNLISLPSAAADSAINTVITSTDVISVVTYDAQAGAWLSATRDGVGALTGTLTSIDAKHAYWINSTSFDPIEVSIPKVGFDTVLPTIELAKGWNMVAIVSLIGDAPGTTTSADTYFGSTEWVTAYGFAPPSTWSKIVPSTFGTVTFGSGYWVYVTEAGTLIPR